MSKKQDDTIVEQQQKIKDLERMHQLLRRDYKKLAEAKEARLTVRDRYAIALLPLIAENDDDEDAILSNMFIWADKCTVARGD